MLKTMSKVTPPHDNGEPGGSHSWRRGLVFVPSCSFFRQTAVSTRQRVVYTKTSQLLHVFAKLQPSSFPGPSIVRFKGLHEGFYDSAVVVKFTLGTDYQVRVVFRDPLDYNRSFAVGGSQNGTFGSLC